MLSFFRALFLFLFWVGLLFVGDFVLFGVPILAIVGIAAVLLGLPGTLAVRETAVAAFATVAFVVLLSLKLPMSDIPEYYVGFIGVVGVVFLFSLISRYFNASRWAGVLCLGSLLALTAFAVTVKAGDPRLDIVFGPNILYRIILFLFGCYLFYSAIHSSNRVWLAVAFLLTTYLVFRTGSRGGMVALAATLGLAYLNSKYKKTYFALGILVAVLVGSIFLDSLLVDSRSLQFGGESSEVRLEKVQAAKNFVQSSNLLIGAEDPRKYTGVYPHNIFLEFFVYHGLIGLALLVALFVALIFRVVSSYYHRLIFLPFAGITVGSLFSGSLMDNYAVLSVCLYCAFLSEDGLRRKIEDI